MKFEISDVRLEGSLIQPDRIVHLPTKIVVERCAADGWGNNVRARMLNRLADAVEAHEPS